MCRFLLAKTPNPTNLNHLLNEFSAMAEASRTVEGDRQGDGWGVSWLDSDNGWQAYHSLKAIWEDNPPNIPETTCLAIHARSASFASQIGHIEYNQPYINNDYVFVFNGMIKGVRLERPIPGKIGAQKLNYLLMEYHQKLSLKESLKKLHHLIKTNSTEITGLNIGVTNGSDILIISDYAHNPEYFTVYQSNTNQLKMVCSEPLQTGEWTPINKQTVVELGL